MLNTSEYIDGKSVAEETTEKFQKQKLYKETASMLDRQCYWDAGNYTVAMVVNTARPEATFRHVWMMAISPEESQKLRANSNEVLLDVVGARTSYYTLYTQLTEKK